MPIKEPRIYLIAAHDENKAIGHQNTLPFKIASDMKRFKMLTTSHAVIMGFNTLESMKNKPLPNRTNYVLTSKKRDDINGIGWVSSVDHVLDMTKNHEKVFIIGGQKVYEQFIDIADAAYLTKINVKFEKADTYFPALPSSWCKIASMPSPPLPDELPTEFQVWINQKGD